MWRTLMEQWTNQATIGTRVVPPRLPLENGNELKFGDVTLRMHHFGTVHTPFDLCVEVLENKLMLVGDVAMDHRIANMDDGSYLGSLKAYDTLEKTGCTLWMPGHGLPEPKSRGGKSICKPAKRCTTNSVSVAMSACTALMAAKCTRATVACSPTNWSCCSAWLPAIRPSVQAGFPKRKAMWPPG